MCNNNLAETKKAPTYEMLKLHCDEHLSNHTKYQVKNIKMKDVTLVVDYLYACLPPEAHWTTKYDECCMIQQVVLEIVPKADGTLPEKFILDTANGQYKIDYLMSPKFYHQLGLKYYSPFNHNTTMKFLSRYLRENGHKLNGVGAGWKTWKPLSEEFGLDATKKEFQWKAKKDGEQEGTFMKLFPDRIRKIGTKGWHLSKRCNRALGLEYSPEKLSTLEPLLDDVNSVVLKHLKGTNAFGDQHLEIFSKIGIQVYEGK
jgi:hypothetical protein